MIEILEKLITLFVYFQDIGAGRGKYYAVNFPMRDGIDDECYQNTFVPIISKVMECYQPSAIVLQCGADSLSGDRLGCFNVTVKGILNSFHHLRYLFDGRFLATGRFRRRNPRSQYYCCSSSYIFYPKPAIIIAQHYSLPSISIVQQQHCLASALLSVAYY